MGQQPLTSTTNPAADSANATSAAVETATDAVTTSTRSRLLGDLDACYRALLSRDQRFDGKFFVGVSSTGIYCRPVCKVRTPRQVNCTFYPTAVAAERAGFRPCLRCRPEQAPGWSHTDISAQLVHAATALINTDLRETTQVSALAARLGVSERHLRRIFESHIGASPRDYIQTQRRLLAKRLLADTRLSIGAVANAAGFASSRAMSANFRKVYGLSPTEIRNSSTPNTAKATKADKADQGDQGKTPSDISGTSTPATGLSLHLSYREPFDFDYLLEFLARRSISGVETVSTEAYHRVVRIEDSNGDIHTGWFGVDKPDGLRAVRLTVSPELLPVVVNVLSIVRHLFDLDADPESYREHLGELLLNNPGIRLPGSADGFEVAVRAVLGQQITVKAARTLATRFVERFGERVEFSGKPELTHAFPSATTIASRRKDSIARLGIIGRRADTIRDLAKRIHRGELDLTPKATFEDTLQTLKSIPGIGDWTAHYLCMRALHYPDAFPAADYGVMKALSVKTPAQATKLAEPWRPWRAYAVMCLWASLSEKKPSSNPSGDS